MRFPIRSIMWNIENFYNWQKAFNCHCFAFLNINFCFILSTFSYFISFPHFFFFKSNFDFTCWYEALFFSPTCKCKTQCAIMMVNVGTERKSRHREIICEKCKIDKIITQIMLLMGGFESENCDKVHAIRLLFKLCLYRHFYLLNIAMHFIGDLISVFMLVRKYFRYRSLAPHMLLLLCKYFSFVLHAASL